MHIVLLGPPGSGKGTQGELLAKRTGLIRVATGDLLRAAVEQQTASGLEAKRYMDQGLLVPDDVMLGLLEEILSKPEAARGVIMDGFPRTIAQAEAVDRLLKARGRKVDHVLLFDVPDSELSRRIVGRQSMQGRSDDRREAFAKRLNVYREQTAPLVDFYRRRGILQTVDAVGPVEAIAERVRAEVGA